MSNGINKVFSGVWAVLVAFILFVLIRISVFFDIPEHSENSIHINQQTKRYPCNTHIGCHVELKNGFVSLNIYPANLPYGQAIQSTVYLLGISARKVTLEFVGRDMPMGLMPFTLSLNEHNTRVGEEYLGIGRVDFCTADPDMTWLARLKIELTDEVIIFVFELDTSEAITRLNLM